MARSLVLALGLVLLVPAFARAQGSYEVQSGDTLMAIAHRFGIGVIPLRRANRLRSDRLRPGQRLRIPPRSSSHRASSARTAGRAGSGSRDYVVRSGNTLTRIAAYFHVGVRTLMRANGLRTATIRPGQHLVIPGRGGSGGGSSSGSQPLVLDDEQREALRRASELGLGGSRVAHRLMTDPPEPRWIAAAGPPDPDGTLLSPVIGAHVLRGWGSGPGGYHLAADIGGVEPGTDIHAAASGVVAYAGSGVRGYGNVVILVHPNGWVTWYAHATQNLVVAGEHVTRGDVISTVGSTGFARGPHLHFMLVYRGEHCDPLPLIRTRTGGTLPARDGLAMSITPTRWTDGRPDGVQCLPRSARPHPRYGYYSASHRHR